MMNQPLRRVDPLGRSTPLSAGHANWPWASATTAGSISPIRGGSQRAIVDTEAPAVAMAINLPASNPIIQAARAQLRRSHWYRWR